MARSWAHVRSWASGCAGPACHPTLPHAPPTTITTQPNRWRTMTWRCASPQSWRAASAGACRSCRSTASSRRRSSTRSRWALGRGGQGLGGAGLAWEPQALRAVHRSGLRLVCRAARLERPGPALAALPLPPRVHMQYGSDVVPLLKRLKYDEKFEPAFRQVGRGGALCAAGVTLRAAVLGWPACWAACCLCLYASAFACSPATPPLPCLCRLCPAGLWQDAGVPQPGCCAARGARD